jgi:activator of HSP90 ATPase
MTESIEVSEVFPVAQRELYLAWLDGKKHTAFTGGEAVIDATVGGRFTAWDGYIEGRIEQLEPPERVLQSWRTTDFPSGSPDSVLEIRIEAVEGGSKLTLLHTNIPQGQGQSYRQGWIDHYFVPMREYFAGS